MLERYGVAPDQFARVCVIVDKIEKMPRDAVEKELAGMGIKPETIDGGSGPGLVNTDSLVWFEMMAWFGYHWCPGLISTGVLV